MKKLTIGVILFAAVFLSSCDVYLIGAYDQVTDQGIQKVQSDVSGLLITLKKNLLNDNPAANAYVNFDKSYSTIEGEIESLNIRCKALPKYTIITNQINLLAKNVQDLEALHKSGISSQVRDTTTINTELKTMEVQFTAMIALQNELKLVKTK